MTQPLDPTFLDELRLLMEDDFPMLLDAYIEDSGRQLQQVDSAWQASDMDQLRRSAHSLKGASGNIGATAFAALCAELEALAAEGSSEGMPELIAKVREQLDGVHHAVAAVRHSS